MPWLEHTYGMSRVVAAQHASALLLGVAFGSLAIGMISDRLGNRRAVMRVYAFLYALSWLPLVLRVPWPLAASLAWFLLMGLLIPGFTLSWAVAKEVNRAEHSGIATSVVNVGIFLGTGILQPLVGWVIDRGRCRRRARRRLAPGAGADRRRGRVRCTDDARGPGAAAARVDALAVREPHRHR